MYVNISHICTFVPIIFKCGVRFNYNSSEVFYYMYIYMYLHVHVHVIMLVHVCVCLYTTYHMSQQLCPTF